MLRKPFVLAAMAVALLLSVAACKKDVRKEDRDTEKPTINLKAPTEGSKLNIGDEHGVHFDVEFVDNKALKSYKVDIHNNFGAGHTHTSNLRHEGEVAFTFDRSWPLNGQRNASVHHHEIKIPKNAKPGKYHIVVYCTDEAGNESHVAANIELVETGGEDHDHEHGHEGEKPGQGEKKPGEGEKPGQGEKNPGEKPGQGEHPIDAHFHTGKGPEPNEVYAMGKALETSGSVHSVRDEVVDILVCLLPQSAVGKSEAELQAMTNTDDCFAVVVYKKNMYGTQFQGMGWAYLDFKIGQPKDHRSDNDSENKALQWAPGKYVYMVKANIKDKKPIFLPSVTFEVK